MNLGIVDNKDNLESWTVVKNDRPDLHNKYSQPCKCNFCTEEFKTRGEHLKHSVNDPPGKSAQPIKKLIERMKNGLMTLNLKEV